MSSPLHAVMRQTGAVMVGLYVRVNKGSGVEYLFLDQRDLLYIMGFSVVRKS